MISAVYLFEGTVERELCRSLQNRLHCWRCFVEELT